MEPVLQEGSFVFAALDEHWRRKPDFKPVLEFREAEGITLVLLREDAERAGLAFSFQCRMITLTVHSSLEAVGFLAAVTRRLADHGISVNAVSAFYHDHLFVPAERAEEAVKLLRGLAAEARDLHP